MVEDSRTSPGQGKRRTTKTLTRIDALQIFQESIRVVQEVGLEIGMAEQDEGLVLLLPGVRLCQDCRNLHLNSDCPYCAA